MQTFELTILSWVKNQKSFEIEISKTLSLSMVKKQLINSEANLGSRQTSKMYLFCENS